MDESIWYKKLEIQVLDKKESLYKRDFKFYHVDTFLKLSKRIDGFSHQCPECLELKTEAEKLAENLLEYLKGDLASRKIYEEKLSLMQKHIRSIHKILPKEYYTSLYSFLGIIVGIALGWFALFMINQAYIKQGLFFGFVFGLILGRIFGNRLDKKLKKANRVLD